MISDNGTEPRCARSSQDRNAALLATLAWQITAPSPLDSGTTYATSDLALAAHVYRPAGWPATDAVPEAIGEP
jgi:hypothetical protein